MGESADAPRVPAGGLLVLGSSGFLGRHVVSAALDRRVDGDRPIVGACRDPWSTALADGWRGWEQVALARELDATDPDAVELALGALRPERIINCVALSSIDRCQADPSLAASLNEDLPRRLARWSADHGARLVHVSTDLVFDGASARPGGYREDDPVGPLNEYGRSKARGEVHVRELDPRAWVVRLPLLYGDSRGTGRGASDSLLAALEEKRQPTLFTDEWRTPLDVRSAAAALVELSLPGEAVEPAADRGGFLHVAGPDRLTRYDIGLIVLTSRGVALARAAGLVRAETRAERSLEATRPADVCLDARVARSFLRTPLLGAVQVLSRGESV